MKAFRKSYRGGVLKQMSYVCYIYIILYINFLYINHFIFHIFGQLKIHRKVAIMFQWQHMGELIHIIECWRRKEEGC